MTTAQPFGRYLINQHMPKGYTVNSALGKKSLNQSMNQLARQDPHLYVNTISNLKQLGDRLATQEGLSVGLDDIQPEYSRRDSIIRTAQQQFNKATSDSRRRSIVEATHKKILDSTMKHKGSLTQQVKSGARGSPIQYMKTVGSPVYARDPKGKVAPWLITKSYSEGLSPADYYVAGNEAIMDTVKSNTSVSEPGELSRILINNMSDLIVTEDDCGTHNGILMDPKNPDAVDRYLAKSVGPFKHNTLITNLIQPKMAKARSRVLVRSPMTCEAGDGVCQKCQGLNEKGNVHEVGTNVGVRAAQAMAEPLTQFALDAKHGVRTAKADTLQLAGIEGFRQIIESPKQFVNKATLASQDGKIGKIEKAPQGGYFVNVDKTQHYVTPNLKVRVKKGQAVTAGDALSEGIPKPDEVVKYKGLGAGRQYMVDSLKQLYQGQGKNLDQRHFELLARGELNSVKILDDPSNTFIPGDVLNYNTLRSTLGKDVKELPLTKAMGETLGKEYLHFSVGTRVTPTVARMLRKEKIDKVMVAPRAPEVEFVMKPATRAPLLNPDWMARLAHRNLKTTIQQAAHFGDVANVHGTSPIPAYAFGVEFGQGAQGRY